MIPRALLLSCMLAVLFNVSAAYAQEDPDEGVILEAPVEPLEEMETPPEPAPELKAEPRPEPPKPPEPVKAEPPKPPEPVKAEPPKPPEPVKAEPPKPPEPVKAEPPKPEPVKAEPIPAPPEEVYGEEFDEDEFDYDGEADEDEKPTFTINGFIQNQTGIFVSPDKDEYDVEIRFPGTVYEEEKRYPSNHGDKFGELSMMRSTLQLEGDWNPFQYASLHWIFRGVRSLKLDADEQAQPPDPAAAGDPRDWVHKNYYTENDLREIYVDLNAGENVNFRIGRQQVTWGELGQYRLLDVVNPVNSTYHFASLESFEDIRIPLWIVKGLVDVPSLEGALEIVWVPMLDNPEDTVTTPLTFVGAWGLPPAPKQNTNSEIVIKRKTFLYPDQDIENSRIGARWKGTLGDLTYNLVYYYTHQLTPPVPTKFVARYVGHETGAVEDEVEVFLEYPRQHIMGFSLDYTFNHPIGTVVRLESSFEPNRTYPVSSDYPRENDPVLFEDAWTYLGTRQKQVVNTGIQLMRPTFIRFLNPNQTIMLIAQVMHSYVIDHKESEQLIDVPGFDSTATNEHALTMVFSAFTYYFHGLMMPRFIAAYIPAKGFEVDPPNTYGNGFLTGQLNFTFDTNWRATLGASMFYGDDPYKGAGLFRDRDEVYARLRYQF